MTRSNTADARAAVRATTSSTGFDYGDLDRSVADEVKQVAGRIRKRTHDAYIENGRDLKAVKAMLGHGAFGGWLQAEFEMSERTAQNLMAAADLIDSKSASISDLPVTAIYKLAAPSTPEDARDGIVARVAQGEKLTVREIESTIRTAKLNVANERRAEMERQRVAHMSPRQRRTKRERKKTDESKFQWQRQAEEERRAATAEVVEILKSRIGPDLPRFVEIFGRADLWLVKCELGGVVRRDQASAAA